jgi:hypothetical protein
MEVGGCHVEERNRRCGARRRFAVERCVGPRQDPSASATLEGTYTALGVDGMGRFSAALKNYG